MILHAATYAASTDAEDTTIPIKVGTVGIGVVVLLAVVMLVLVVLGVVLLVKKKQTLKVPVNCMYVLSVFCGIVTCMMCTYQLCGR